MLVWTLESMNTKRPTTGNNDIDDYDFYENDYADTYNTDQFIENKERKMSKKSRDTRRKDKGKNLPMD